MFSCESYNLQKCRDVLDSSFDQIYQKWLGAGSAGAKIWCIRTKLWRVQ